MILWRFDMTTGHYLIFRDGLLYMTIETVGDFVATFRELVRPVVSNS